MTDKRAIQIGGRTFQAHYDEKPIDGFYYTVEGTSNLNNHYGQQFYPRFLEGVTAHNFPVSTDLIIFELKSGFRHLELLYVKKLKETCNLTLTVTFDYHKWDLAESLASFVDRYVAKLEQEKFFDIIEPAREEYGFKINGILEIKDQEDIFAVFCRAERLLEIVYRKHLVPVSKDNLSTYGDDRFHWWIRYVLVPLAGSSAIAAVLAHYLINKA